MLSSPSLMPNCSSAKSRIERSHIRLRRSRFGVTGRRGRAMKRSTWPSVAFISRRSMHQVEHAALEQELAALESVGQLLPDGLLDDARAGESDQRLRLGDVEIAQHRKARGHAAGRGIGEDRDVGQPRAIEPRQRRGDLRHLHQRQRAFHHARAARARHDQHRRAPLERQLDAAHDLLADHDAHRAADEAVFHRRHHRLDAVDAADADDHRVLLAGGFLRGGEPRLVRLGVGELQRIVRGQVRRQLFPPLIVEERFQPFGGAEAEVVRALAADVQVLDEILGVDDGVAFRTLHPQAFGDPAGLRGRRNRLARLFEPRHIGSDYDSSLVTVNCQLPTTSALRSSASPCPCP